jgi:hypothetical protein
MKRRFYDAKQNTFLYLTIHSPGLYLYHDKPLGAKILKALAIHEAPLTASAPEAPPLAFGKPQAYKGEFRASRA